MPTRASGSSSSKSTTSKKKTTAPKTAAAATARKTTAKPTRAVAKPTTAKAVKPAPVVVTDTPAVASSAELKKNELVESVVARSGVRKKFAKPAVEAAIDILGEAIAEGRDLNLQPMGKVIQKRRKETSNARITVARIRQSKAAGPALSRGRKTDTENPDEVVADVAE